MTHALYSWVFTLYMYLYFLTVNYWYLGRCMQGLPTNDVSRTCVYVGFIRADIARWVCNMQVSHKASSIIDCCATDPSDSWQHFSVILRQP
jgi:hypothetical protein